MRSWLSVLAVLLISCPAGLASSRDQQEHGASVFAQSGCTYCHSIRKVGGTKGPDLSGVGRRLKVDQMRQQIVEGSKIMPSFKDVLNDSDLADLLAYLHSCRDKKKK